MSGFFKDSRVDGLSDEVDIVTSRVDGHCASIKTLNEKNVALLNTVKELLKKIDKLELEMGALKQEQVFLTNKYDEVVYRNNKKRKVEMEKDAVKKVKVKVEAEDN
jgi:hypothetical protein